MDPQNHGIWEGIVVAFLPVWVTPASPIFTPMLAGILRHHMDRLDHIREWLNLSAIHIRDFGKN
jgi:hypothetical protein